MRIKTKVHKVDLSGTQGQREFTVKAGAHIMQVLSGLYSNPVDAMVREYVTNMYDAYIALKRVNPSAEIIPPVLRLPTALSGHLEFQDFGIGMSKDTVWNVYATYGETTKNTNNDEVGGFGLGSKTAFCYNDGASWSIVSRFEGEKHTFMAFIGKDGVPNLTHVSTVPTDEHSGVTVTVPIRRQDIEACVTAAKKYAPLFPMDLVVEGAEISPVSYVVRGNRWGVRTPMETKRQYGYYNREVGVRVIMGNVPYRAAPDQITNVIKRDHPAYTLANNNLLDLYVDVGAVDIVPSRDDMKYTPRTSAAISRALNLMVSELPTAVGDLIGSAKTQWDFVVKAQSVFENISGVEKFVPKVLFNGVETPTDRVVCQVSDFTAIDRTGTVDVYSIESDSRSQIVHTTPPELVLRPHKETTFVVVDDMPRGGVSVARALVYNKLVNRGHNGRSRRYGHKIGHAIVFKTTATKKQISTLFGGMPVENILYTSQLSGTISIPQAAKGVKETLYRWSGGNSWQSRVNIPSDPGTTYYYLPLSKGNGHRWTYTNTTWGSQKDAMRLIEVAVEQLQIPYDGTVYGIRDTELDIVSKKKNWVNLLTKIESAFTDLIKTDAMSLALAAVDISGDVWNLSGFLRQFKATYQSIPELAQFASDCELIEKAKTATVCQLFNTFNTLVKGSNDLRKKMIKGISVPDLKAQFQIIRQKFPMLICMIDFAQEARYGYRGSFNTAILDTTLDYLKERS